MKRFAMRFRATVDDVDELGHVNNAVWVRWIQDVAVAHWNAAAPPDVRDAVFWVVTRHEIDYRANIGAGEAAEAETWVADAPRGARFDRHVRFTNQDGRMLVEALTSWALIDRATGKLRRVREDVTAPFAEAEPIPSS